MKKKAWKIILILGILIFLIFGVGTFICNKFSKNIISSEKENNKVTKTIIDKKSAILLNSDYNKWLEKEYGYEKWNPIIGDLAIIQVVLDKAILNNEFYFIKKPINQNIKEYYRQYIPYLNEEGERVIVINAFCRISELPPNTESETKKWTKMDWRKQYVMVNDGGLCYWRITINLDKKTYNDLMVNGVS